MAKIRDNVPESLKWRVEDIYETPADWEAAYSSLEDKLDLSEYKGKLGDADVLFECLEKLNEIDLELGKLSVYAFMKRDEDTRKSEFTALQSRVDMLNMKLSANAAFITPELTALPVKTLKEFAENTPGCYYIDASEWEELSNPDLLVADGVHFNAEGYRLYGEFFKEALKDELARF